MPSTLAEMVPVAVPGTLLALSLIISNESLEAAAMSQPLFEDRGGYNRSPSRVIVRAIATPQFNRHAGRLATDVRSREVESDV